MNFEKFIKNYNELQLAVFGWVMNNSVGAEYLISHLTDEDFSEPYEKIFKILKKQYLERQTVDFIEIVQCVPAIQLSTYNHYASLVMTSFDFKKTVEKIKTAAKIARIFKHVTDMLDEAGKGNFNISKSLVNDVLNIDLNTESRWLSTGDVLKLDTKSRDIIHVFSKFPSLNEHVYSYKSGDLHIIAARPGVGKTTFLLNEAAYIASTGEKVAFMTLEMPALQCVRRLVSSLANVPFKELYKNDVFIDAIKRSGVESLPIYFYEDYSLGWEDVLLKIRKIAMTGARVIFIDQLSHIKHDSRAYSKTDAIEKTVRAIRSLALELNIVIILAVQISRAANAADTPDLEHLKDSGSIEEASQLVLMLQRKDNCLRAYIRKATHGTLGQFDIVFDADICTVYEGESVFLGNERERNGRYGDEDF